MAYEFPDGNVLSNTKCLEQRFRLLNNARSGKLEYLREMAAYVNSGLLPEYEYSTDDLLLREKFSSFVSVLVEQLGSKIVAAIYPLNNIPFFNWNIGRVAQFNPDQMAAANTIAQQTEFYLANRLEASNYRQALHNAVTSAIVLGDSLMYQSDDYEFRVYPVTDFVLRRDASGQIAELIIRDWLEPDLLPEELKNINRGQPKSTYASKGRLEPHFTKLMWNVKDKKWEVEKEFREEIYETGKTYTHSPYYHINWSRVNAEDYGRSLVEINWGEIRSLEMLTKALVESAAAISRVHPAVDPTGLTREDALDHEDLHNMDVISARQQDVFWLTPPIQAQLQALAASVQMSEDKLSKVFLSDTARSLTGERVTAYQIQQAVQEMEQTLGNVLGSIAQQIQRPVVLRSLAIEEKSGRWPKAAIDLLREVGRLEIKTGLDALGRQLEGARLQSLLGVLQALPPESVQSLNFDNILNKLMVSSGLDPSELQYSDEEQAARAEAQQQAALQQQAAQQAIQTTGSVVEQQFRNQQ